jgi:chromosome segregation ATPase
MEPQASASTALSLQAINGLQTNGEFQLSAADLDHASAYEATYQLLEAIQRWDKHKATFEDLKRAHGDLSRVVIKNRKLALELEEAKRERDIESKGHERRFDAWSKEKEDLKAQIIQFSTALAEEKNKTKQMTMEKEALNSAREELAAEKDAVTVLRLELNQAKMEVGELKGKVKERDTEIAVYSSYTDELQDVKFDEL